MTSIVVLFQICVICLTCYDIEWKLFNIFKKNQNFSTTAKKFSKNTLIKFVVC